MRYRKSWVLIGVTLCMASAAMALPATFNGSSGKLDAEVTFNVFGSSLLVTLTNTSPHDVLGIDEVLTAVFFQSDMALHLIPISATVPHNSEVLFGTTDPGNVVGGEWAYRSNLPLDDNLHYGISAASFDLFDIVNLFPGTNLQGPLAPGGIEYGITSAGDNPLTGTADVTGRNALIKNEVTFILFGVPLGFNPEEHIEAVMFQYGRDLRDPHIFVPEPAAAGLLLLGSLFACRRRSVRGY